VFSKRKHKVDSLRFDRNWRRILLLNKPEDADIYSEAEYVSLDPSKIGKLTEFCKRNWEKLGFDYDSYSYLVWPLNDGEPTERLVDRLNSKFASCAQVVLRTPAEAHGLGFGEETSEFFE